MLRLAAEIRHILLERETHFTSRRYIYGQIAYEQSTFRYREGVVFANGADVELLIIGIVEAEV